MKKYNRRAILQFLGRAGIVTVGLTSGASMLSGCKGGEKAAQKTVEGVEDVIKSDLDNMYLVGIEHSDKDDLVLAEGLDFDIIIQWGEPISDKDTFGFNNDYTAFVPLDEKGDDGLLWVNHEYMSPMFVSGYMRPAEGEEAVEKTLEQVEKEQYEVGGTIVRIKKDSEGKWRVVHNDPHNRRFTAKTKIPFAWDEPIAGSNHAIGTFANCSGGITPWGTILTAEENYQYYYGDTDYTDPEWKRRRPETLAYGWEKHFDYPPEHYGWVVEVDLKTGHARKLVALGRCAHECATIFEAPDGRLVVYTGDDDNDQCLYKFISSKPGSLTEGTLYVANVETGKWISLDIEEQPILKEHFKSQTEVLIRLREAADLLGGSKLARPEDIEIDPITKDVFVSLTNNVPKKDYYGQILKIVEKSPDKTSLEFEAITFMAGGEETGFACPDNMAFDQQGNLWFTSDISGSKMNKGEYEIYKNNGLYVVPVFGRDAGLVVQVASAPTDAELTGPFFSPDGKTLFLSVQHPGERSPNLQELTSHWPNGGDEIPKSAVVAVTGRLLERLTLGREEDLPQG